MPDSDLERGAGRDFFFPPPPKQANYILLNAGPRKHRLDTVWDVWPARRCQCKCSTLCSPLRLPAEIARPLLSAENHGKKTGLALDDNPRLQHIKGFNSTLGNRNGMFFLQAEIRPLPQGTKLQTHNTKQGQIGMIAPTTTLTPTRLCRYRICRRFLAIQHKRRTCQSTQAIQKDTLHTIKNTVSSPRRTS